MGIKHSGKSSLGSRLAGECGVRFHDLDRVIEEHGQGRRWLSVREIYRTLGREGFVKLEAEAVSASAEAMRENPAVLALGGGTIENTEAMSALPKDAVRVYLEEDREILFRRIIRGGLPPFLDPADPEGSFHRLYEKRSKLYREAADVVVRMEGCGPDKAFRKLVKALEEGDYGGE